MNKTANKKARTQGRNDDESDCLPCRRAACADGCRSRPRRRRRRSRGSSGCTCSIAATSRSPTWGASRPAIPVPVRLSSTCYLIKHAQGWLLWDTGLGDAIASMPEGQKSNAGVWHVKKTLASQLDEIGVKPSDITLPRAVAFARRSCRQRRLFPQATLLVQKAEYEWPEPTGTPRFPKDMQVIKAEGDHDVFGDGSVTADLDAGPFARPPVPPGQAAEDRRGPAHGRRRSHPGQLGQQAHPDPEL